MSNNAVDSIEGLCRLLVRSRLLTAEEIESLVQRWRRQAGEPDDLAEFARWLVAGSLVTEYQMGRLRRGHADNFFLAGYKLLDQLGRGKETGVYRAIDEVGEVAALKILPPSRGRDPQVLGRFRREVRVARFVNHANVVRVLDAGEERGAHYLVMEYLEGETLQQALAARGTLEPRSAADLARQALEGLAHLHEVGVVHGNLEPAHLFLAQPDVAGDLPAVKLLDFGLAWPVGADHPLSEGDDVAWSAEEGLLAAPSYRAPEVAGAPPRDDSRSDLYSLGCVLYHALTGQPPGPQAPRLLPELNPEIPEELAVVVAGLMAAAPDERFASAAEAAAPLRAWLARQQAAVVVTGEPLSWLADHSPAPVATVVPTPPPLPAPPPEAPPVAPRADAPVPPAVVEVEAVIPTVEVERVAVAPRPTWDQEERAVGLDRRDFLMLLAGAGALLAVQLLAWSLARLLSLLRRPPPDTSDSEKQGEEG
jgi:serine/threonine protein kinase